MQHSYWIGPCVLLAVGILTTAAGAIWCLVLIASGKESYSPCEHAYARRVQSPPPLFYGPPGLPLAPTAMTGFWAHGR